MHLPRPYPDELVGSMLHRAERILGIGQGQFLQRLTSHRMTAHSLWITSYERVAHAYGFSLPDFLRQHTVFQYVTAYMPPVVRQRILQNFTKEGYVYASMIRRSVIGEHYLKLCPSCVTEEMRQYGESYWHRAHQLSAVEVCLQHQVPLHWTTQKMTRATALVPPHEAGGYLNAQGENSLPLELKLALASASAKALWALDSQHNVVQTYRQRAHALGYGYIGPRMHGALLANDLDIFYGKAFLDRYGCLIDENDSVPWPAQLLNARAQRKSTFKHILLNLFLDSHPTPSQSRSDFEQRHRPKPRSWHEIENDAIEVLTAEIERHRAMGTRANLKKLYALAGIQAVVYGHPHQVPKLMDWLEKFKKSPQSSRIAGGRWKQ